MHDLEASASERTKLAETVRELSTPVIRVLHSVIAMLLIWHIDNARAQQIEASLLEGIQRYEASKVNLDLTGVAMVDVE